MSTYFDHNATSPLHPQVLKAMMPYLSGPVANASSLHSPGRMARSAIENARASLANLVNETGVLQPVKQLAELVAGRDCLIHTDATQMAGKLVIDMSQLGVEALTLSAHKLQGPQGVGALITGMKPKQVLISGGAQEKYRRAGTENVASIVGFGKAAELAGLENDDRYHHLRQLKEVFESRLMSLPGAVIFGQEVDRLPNTTFFALPYYHGETLLMELDKSGFALSSGSACHSEVTQPSHVLNAMQVDDNIALNAVRVSMGFDNTLQQVDALTSKLEQLINKLPAIIRQAAV